MRAAADVAAVASPLTPYAIYNTPICNGWCSAGGTSLAAPLISGIIALAGNASSRHAGMEIWQSHSSLKNITSGTNVYAPVTGPCASKVKATCVAGPGYNGPTGWGTPEGVTDF
jgi:subtilase family serine protease